MNLMVQAVDSMTRSGPPPAHLWAFNEHMRELHSNLDRASSSRGDDAEVPQAGAQAEHALFVTDLTHLLTALLPHLHTFSMRLSLPASSGSSIGTSEEELFWELWCFLRAGCTAFSSTAEVWPTLWPKDQRPFHAPLIAAFHAVLVWLLQFSRSSAWLAMTPKHGLASRNHELIMVLMQPIACLSHMHHAQPRSSLLAQLQALPCSFFPLVCCIATEQFGACPSSCLP